MCLLKRSGAPRLKTRVIFHASSLGLPERQQLGQAELSPRGFRLRLSPKPEEGIPATEIAVPLDRIDNVRAYQKKTYSSTFYVVEVAWREPDGTPRTVAFEIRVFLRRGRALATARAWKAAWRRLAGAA
ncbi:hypothetical protein G3N55_10805 [Dissulfurirhabdus thermomarina]|uniref:Uncharacterized protein n=1 Tax=Dissulfurirhabdus thermomarina TaxID=1765737 RepID=A0A6N9TV67_DISTH|nr:hypothetical protein [Dissulfurirhabdus thermomarina]NDY43327.1 hypothetical protein [Dissulfurirhabdus thermomarina]NMX23773.1 hypothetical protein [Dissulfurirhabdus thermomarina]